MHEALVCRPSNNGRNSAPLRWHNFSKMKKFLFLFKCPFCFLHAWVQPLIPASTPPANRTLKCTPLTFAGGRNTLSLRETSECLSTANTVPYHLALHCFADFLTRREATRLQLFRPYFMTAALRISSSLFLHTPPLINMRTIFHLARMQSRFSLTPSCRQNR